MKLPAHLDPSDEKNSAMRLRAHVAPPAETNSTARASLPSTSLETLPITSIIEILDRIDHLDEGATGALVYRAGGREIGAILIEKSRICWALSRGLGERLTDLLVERAGAFLDRPLLEELVTDCRARKQPLGEALVERGLVSSAGLREALLQHSLEALASLAGTRGQPVFLPHKRDTYDPQFSFSTAEMLAAFGASKQPLLAEIGRLCLVDILQEKASGAAFARGDGGRPLLVCIHERTRMTTTQVRHMSDWATSQIDIAEAMSPGLGLVSAGDREGRAIVAWKDADLSFIALCEEGPTWARVLRRASRR